MKYLLVLALVLSGCMLSKSKLPQPGEFDKEIIKTCFFAGEGLSELGCARFGLKVEFVRHRYSPVIVTTTGSPYRLRAAVNYWNKALGFTMFMRATSNEQYVAVTVTERPQHIIKTNTLGETYFKQKQGRLYTPIILYGQGRHVNTLIHELGHAIGLEHDQHDKRSIMYPFRSGRYMSKIQDVDLKLLRKIYN